MRSAPVNGVTHHQDPASAAGVVLPSAHRSRGADRTGGQPTEGFALVASFSRYPVIDTACNGYLGGINAALRNIAALCDAQTRVVPGSGAVSALPALQHQLEIGNLVLTRMSENFRKGGTFADLVALKPTRDFDAEYGDPALFLRQSYDSALYQVNPMGGLTTGQPPAAPAGRAR